MKVTENRLWEFLTGLIFFRAGTFYHANAIYSIHVSEKLLANTCSTIDI